MEKDTFVSKEISHNGSSYFQYDLASSLSGISFFDINNLLQVKDMYPESEKELHSHSVYCVVWFYTGEGDHNIDFETYNIERDTVFFLSPRHLHFFYHLKNISGVSILFSEDFLLHLDSELVGVIKSKLFYPFEGASYCKIPESAKEKLSGYVKLMQNETHAENRGESLKEKFLASALSLFFIDVMRLGEWENSVQIIDVMSSLYQVYQKYNELVEKNFAKQHLVKFYLDALQVSQTTLNTSTHQYAHVPPLKLINARIIREAKRLLCNSPLQVKEIAFQLGFEDVSYFTKQFKREVGVSPLDFRSQKGAEVE